jgi:hypothetical protein
MNNDNNIQSTLSQVPKVLYYHEGSADYDDVGDRSAIKALSPPPHMSILSIVASGRCCTWC